MRKHAICAILIALAVPSSPAAGPGDWNVFLDPSAIVGIECIGDTLWCATNGGILLFDLADSTFTQFMDGLRLRSGEITAVTFDRNGSIWAAFDGEGITRIDNPSTDPVVAYYNERATVNEILSDSVTCLERAGGEIYYGSAKGVGKFFDNLHALEPNLSDSLGGRRVNDLLYDASENVLWVAWDGGIGRFDRDTYDYTSYPAGPSYSLCAHDGGFYCATLGGVRRFDGAGWPVLGAGFHVMPPLAVASGDGKLYAATSERLYIFGGVNWTGLGAADMKAMFNDIYRIRTNHIRALAVDSRGTPWIGGRTSDRERGSWLSAYVDGSWRNMATPLLSQNNIVALGTAPQGGVWASTNYGISHRSGDGDWISYTKMRIDTGTDDALSYFASNLALLFDGSGRLWCNAQNYDLDMIEVGDPLDGGDDLWSHFSVSDGTTITSNRFVKAKADPAGNRWFMSDDDQQIDGKWGINIASASGSEWLSINPSTTPLMASGSVFDCAFAPGGVYLALRGTGVQYWMTGGFSWNSLASQAGDAWVTILNEDNLPNTQLSAIELGPDGSLWIGTSGGLIRRLGDGSVDSLKAKTGYFDEGLVGMLVYDLELDARGNLWVATNQGLNRINTDGEVDRAYTTASLWEERFQFVYPNDVISPLPDHVCKSLAYDESTDMLWIGTDDGLARLDVSPESVVEVPLEQAILYPNPVCLQRGDESLRISRISGSVDISVYNLEGELVHQAEGVTEGGEAWDLQSLNGYKVMAGIYIVRITGAGSSEMRKVAVIK